MTSELEDFIKRDNDRFLVMLREEKKITLADIYQRAHLITQWRRTESDRDYDELFELTLIELRNLVNASGLVIKNY
ncbi:TPA: hypothetical protein MDT29_000877 [Klebsiella pneumoniae]|nr:hypothetical protein [Klebsiella pneumoniae]HBV3020938.1 hypothetical protein [Klebsiella pneumoniae]HBV3057518.1 hypothetical protein [Klebsiella pneumoniae]